MLRSIHDLDDYDIDATDGSIGSVKDIYFDDEKWVIRYLVVETGSWLSSRRVLVSPIAIGAPDWSERRLHVSLTKEQVKNSPDIDTDKPVSRQHEIRYLGYYGYPFYWGGAGLWGNGAYPGMMIGYPGYAPPPYTTRPEAEDSRARAEAARHQDDDPHLRSCNAVLKFHIEASDGDIGHVSDLLVDDETWAVRYIVVDTSNWWFGHKVIIAPEWIQSISWPEATVSVNLTQQDVKDAPPYDPEVQLERKQEISVHEHYGRPGYWGDEVNPDHSNSRQ
jgi:sporulation protein YlmC with PRC-barrel domain